MTEMFITSGLAGDKIFYCFLVKSVIVFPYVQNLQTKENKESKNPRFSRSR